MLTCYNQLSVINMIKNLHVYCTILMMVLIKNKTYMGYFKHFWSFETIEFQILYWVLLHISICVL